MLVTVCRHAAVFEEVEPLFNLSDPHCIITESVLNFADCFRLSISKFQTTLDAVLLLQAFCHLERKENLTNTCHTTLLSGNERHLAVLRGSKK
jgi:hypothetical protein